MEKETLQDKYMNLLERFIALQDKHCNMCRENNTHKREVNNVYEQLDRVRKENLQLTSQYNTIKAMQADSTNEQVEALKAELQETKQALITALSHTDAPSDEKDTMVADLKKELANLKRAEHIHKKMLDWIKYEQHVMLPSMKVLNTWKPNLNAVNEKPEPLPESLKALEEAVVIAREHYPDAPSVNTPEEPVRKLKKLSKESMLPTYGGSPIEYEKGDECPFETMQDSKHIAPIGKGYCVRRCPFHKHHDEDQQIVWCSRTRKSKK